MIVICRWNPLFSRYWTRTLESITLQSNFSYFSTKLLLRATWYKSEIYCYQECAIIIERAMHGHNKPPLLSFGARLAVSMRHNTPISPKITGYFSDLEAVKKNQDINLYQDANIGFTCLVFPKSSLYHSKILGKTTSVTLCATSISNPNIFIWRETVKRSPAVMGYDSLQRALTKIQ